MTSIGQKAILLILVFATNAFGQEWIGCLSTQYAEIGSIGYIHCTFPTPFKAVYWYDDVTNPAANPLLSYTCEYTELGNVNIYKGGQGYDDGDFDVMLNGSLIITKVSLQHEKMFKALCIDRKDVGRTFVVTLTVTVSPTLKNPVVQSCGEEACIIHANTSQNLICEFDGARPPVHLQWQHRLAEVDLKMESTETTRNNSVTFSTKAVLELPIWRKKVLVLLVCKAEYFLSKWESEIQVLVDLSRRKSFYTNEPSVIYSEINGEIKLPTPLELSRSSVLLWKMGDHKSEKAIAISVLGRAEYIDEYDRSFEMSPSGELIIPTVDLNDEGIYTGIYSDDNEDIVAVVKLVVLVPPSPPYLVISGCARNDGCVIEAQKGSLTCSVHSVRPMATLEWSTTSSFIRLSKSKHQSEEYNGLFDVSETVEYELLDGISCGKLIEVRCKAYGPPAAIFQSSTTLQLTQGPTNCSMDNISLRNSSSAGAVWIIVLLTAFALIVVAITAVFCLFHHRCHLCRHLRRKNNTGSLESESGSRSEEAQPLTEGVAKENKEIKEAKERLIKELKMTYGSKFDAEDIYLPRKLSVIKTRKHPGWELTETSSRLESYHCIFKNSQLELKNRIIIEGGTGYGKTWFAFHMARDWCRDANDSPLSDFDIFILLSLKGVDDTTSIYDSITRQLLSEGCGLKGKDVKAILDKEEKYIVVLDHYHEYYERKTINNKDGNKNKDITNRETFVDKIMSSKMLQNAKVIALSLSSPTVQENIYGKGPTVVRIEKFTSEQVDEYLHHVFKNEQNKRKRFKKQINQNREISNLCDIPLFLRMISESYKNSKGEQLRFNKISHFFEDWFKLKHKRSTVTENERFDLSEWEEIAKTAIEGIKNQQTVWTKSDFMRRVGEDCFNIFKNMGVIVETKFHVDSVTQKHKSKQENNVKFINIIYQQFIGAQYLAFFAKATEFEEMLSWITLPKNLQLIVFACGINNKILTNVVKFFLKEGTTLELKLENLIYSCFNEVENLDEDEMKGILKSVVDKLHGITFRDYDSNNITMGKVSSIETMCDRQIEIPAITFANVAKTITDASVILLDCDRGVNIRARVKAYIIEDESGNIKPEDVMRLVKAASCVETVVVKSSFSPSETTTDNDFIQKIQQEKQISVTWITTVITEDEDSIVTCYPSSKLGKWINLDELLQKPEETVGAEVPICQSISKDIMGFLQSILEELNTMDNASEQSKAACRHKIEKLGNQVLKKLEKENIRIANDSRIVEFKEGGVSMYGHSLSSWLFWYRWIYFLHKAIEEGN